MSRKIRLSPKKLDAAADDYFESVRYHEANSHWPVTKTYLESCTLAGLALRRWAMQMRKAARAKK